MITRILIIISGFSWIFAGVLFFAFSISIVSMPERLSAVKTVTMLFFVFYVITGALFLFTAHFDKKQKYFMKLNKSLISMLRINNLSISIVAYAMKNNLSIEDAQVFINKKNFTLMNKLSLTKDGLIIFGPLNGKNKESRRNIKRK